MKINPFGIIQNEDISYEMIEQFNEKMFADALSLIKLAAKRVDDFSTAKDEDSLHDECCEIAILVSACNQKMNAWMLSHNYIENILTQTNKESDSVN
jgi:hypothetical protein